LSFFCSFSLLPEDNSKGVRQLESSALARQIDEGAGCIFANPEKLENRYIVDFGLFFLCCLSK
jgi:hypothetical protein